MDRLAAVVQERLRLPPSAVRCSWIKLLLRGIGACDSTILAETAEKSPCQHRCPWTCARIVAVVEGGSSIRHAARRFAVSPSAAIKLMQRVRATGSPAPARAKAAIAVRCTCERSKSCNGPCSGGAPRRRPLPITCSPLSRTSNRRSPRARSRRREPTGCSERRARDPSPSTARTLRSPAPTGRRPLGRDRLADPNLQAQRGSIPCLSRRRPPPPRQPPPRQPDRPPHGHLR
jgi:hypothetical protein